MGSSATTRKARTAAGKCTVCLKRKATPGHVTCSTCRRAISDYSADRYERLRREKRCARCGQPADGYLCPEHAAERRRRRAKRVETKPRRGGSPAPDLPKR